MTTSTTCARCGVPLPAGRRAAFCPSCLLLGALTPLPAEPPDEEALPPAAAAPATLRVGDYELLEPIARGGMGSVWRARRVTDRRLVAFKTVAAGLLASDAERRRFRTEIESAAQLEHPNIVPIYEVGDDEGRPFYTMRLMEGGTLAGRISNRKSEISNHDAARLLVKVARAVHFAHERGILHRDLKPGNILLDAAGEPGVSDFGLARRLELDSSLTLSGDVLGTPAYLAPEVAAGGSRHATIASDLYSLGAILYELLTGQPPFTAPTVPELLRRVTADDPIPPRVLRRRIAGQHAVTAVPASGNAPPDTPARTPNSDLPSPISHLRTSDLDTVCLKCLAKHPAARYSSAAALADDLERWLSGEPIQARPPTLFEFGLNWARRNRAGAALLAVAAVLPALIIAGLLWANAYARREREQTRLNLYAADMLLADRARQEGNVGLARRALTDHLPGDDGSDLRGFEWRYLWDQSRSASLATLAGPTARIRCLAFSPDGQTLAAGSHDRSLFLWDVPTRTLRSRLEPGLGRLDTLAWCPDAPMLALGDDRGVVGLWDLSGERLVWQFASPRVARICFLPGRDLVAVHSWGEKAAAATTFDGHPHFVKLYNWRRGEWAGEWEMGGDLEAVSADGRIVATTAHASDRNAPLKDWVELRDAASGAVRRTLPLTAYFLALSPDGERVAAVGFGAREIQVSGRADASQITLLAGHADRVNALRFNRRGDLLISGGEDHTVRVWDVDAGHETRRLLGHEAEVWAVDLSPDGRLIASGSGDGRVHLWANDPPVRRADAGRLFPPFQLSPDGRFLAALEGRDGSDPAKQPVVRELVSGREVAVGKPGDFGPVGFGPGGESVTLVEWDAEKGCRLQAWDFTTGELRRTTALADSQDEPVSGLLSSDGTLFAATSADRNIRVWRVATGELAAVMTGPLPAFTAVFSEDGRTLASCHYHEGSRFGLCLWDLPSGRQRFAGQWEDAKRVTAAFSPDGGTLAVGLVNGTIELRRVADGTLLGTLSDRRGGISAIAFTPDGRTLGTSYTGTGGALKLWHLATRRELAVLHRGPSCPRWIQFTADGEHLVGVDWLGSQHVYRAPPLAELDLADASEP